MEDYIKESNIIELSEEDRKIQLLESIIKTQNDLKYAQINYEFAEKELIDFYSYQIKANQSKLDYLTKLAKNLNISNFTLQ